MNNDTIMEMSAETAQQMQNLMMSKMDGMTMKDDSEFLFTFSCMTLSSLFAGFIDAIIDNAHPQQKIKLLHDITNMTAKLLHVKDVSREIMKHAQ